MKITVVQTDNRSFLQYVKLTQSVNKKMCFTHGYNYQYIELNPKYFEKMHPATSKILFVHDFLQEENDIIVFLDTDAWIHNPNHLNDIIEKLIQSPKHGCYSRDPYMISNTYINSGSFILKVNEYTKNMYKTLVENLETHKYNNWRPCDQNYISDFVYDHRDDFIVFVPNVINTPRGMVLKHNWQKNQTMFYELRHILSPYNVIQETRFEVDKYYDNAPFPNESDGDNFFN